jgi:large subunit ribosomal protein L4
MRRKANRNALLAKLVDNEVKIIDSMSFDQPRTKAVEGMLEAIKIDRSCLMAIAPDNMNARMSARNVAGLSVCPPSQLTVYEMLNHRYLIIAKDDLDAWLNGASSKTDKSAKADVRSRTTKKEVAA